MSEESNPTVYTGDGIRAVLTPEGNAHLFEVTIAWEAGRGCAAVDLEVLLQPRAGNGSPRGTPQRLYSTSIELRRVRQNSPARGHCWLPPSLPADLLRTCYFRVCEARIDGQGGAET